MNDVVVCVSAGLVTPKKAGVPFAEFSGYLNYGLLSIATALKSNGYHVVQMQGDFCDVETVIENLAQRQNLPSRWPVLLSLPSSFSLVWAAEFVSKIKARFSETRVIVGGRWVVAEDGDWIRRRLPGVDLVVYGEAEGRIASLLDINRWRHVPFTDMCGKRGESGLPPGSLDFSIVDGYERYQPCVEVSRGCGKRCVFCAEGQTPLGKMAPVTHVLEAFEEFRQIYSGPVSPYLQASFFRPTLDWARRLAGESGHVPQTLWRAETRVDSISPEIVQALAEGGLKVLDLGLESASSRQLLTMGKTKNPSHYLQRAQEILSACSGSGVWAKVNVLWYPGETEATVAETRNWLEANSEHIKGVSVGPMIVYRYGPTSSEYMASLDRYGAKPVLKTDLDSLGYARMHLSAEIDQDRANELSLEVSRQLMTSDDYYDLKSFSYFPRGFTREDFHDLVRAIDPRRLQFQTT